ncbi:MAG: hypothetical protein AAFY15_10275 [Cyanobacteria bacterium J06648_11]
MTEWTFTSIIVITFNVAVAVILFWSLPSVYKLRRTFQGVARSMTELAETLGASLQPAPAGLTQASTSIQSGRQSVQQLKRSTRLLNGILRGSQWAIARLTRK